MRKSYDSRIELLFALLNALRILQEFYRPFTMPMIEVNKVVKELKRASSLVKEYPNVINKLSLTIDLVESFDQPANFIDQVIMDFQTSNDITETNIKGKLITYLNTVVHGNLLDLPKLKIEPSIRSATKKARAYHYFLLAIYLVAPIIFIISINLLFGIKFDEYGQSLLKILYIIWAFVGVFLNPIILNSDSKELIQDIIKSWLGKS